MISNRTFLALEKCNCALSATQPDFEVCGEAEGLAGALAILTSGRPDMAARASAGCLRPTIDHLS
jgi:hypothetical protein